MKKLNKLLSILLVFTFVSVFSQDNKKIYTDLVEIKDLIYDDVEAAEKKLVQMKSLVDRSKSDTISGLYYRTLYNLYTNQLNNDRALEAINTSIEFYKKAKYAKGTALSIMNKGNIYLKKAEHKKAAENYFEALKIAEKNNLRKEIGLLNKNIGTLFFNQNKNEEALLYANKALKIFTEIDNKKEIAGILINIANVYYAKYDSKNSIEYSNRALKLSEELKDSVNMAKLYNNLGAVLYEEKIDTVKALQYLLKSLELKKALGIEDDLIFANTNVATMYANRGEYDEAKKYLDIAFEMAKKFGHREELKEIYSVYSIIYYGKKDYKKAVDNERLYGKYKDSILNEENSKIVEEINTKYKTAEKDNEIITQKSKIFKRNVAVFSLLGLLLLGLVYYKNYQNRQKIKLQREILHQQDLATKAVMNAEDNERKRMATHLHDGIGQLLSAVNMNVSVLDEMRDNDEGYSKILGKTKDILNEAIADVRSLSHQIMPNMLIKNSLSNALRELIEKSNSPRLNITLYMEGLNDAIDQNIQIVLYRTIQECINNTIKHAEASHINISIIQDREKITTHISDNGKGFDIFKMNSKNEGLGLENIRSRIDILKGNFDVKSKEGEGTSIKVEIPLT